MGTKQNLFLTELYGDKNGYSLQRSVICGMNI